MKFPTIMIQLRTDNGLPVDMPDDLQTAALDIGMQLQEAWLTGVDCIYGSVDRELFLKAEKEIDGDLIKDIEVPVELDDIESCRNEVAHLMLAIRDLTDENLLLLKTNMKAGHGGASGRFEYLKEVALDYAFLFKLENITE